MAKATAKAKSTTKAAAAKAPASNKITMAQVKASIKTMVASLQAGSADAHTAALRSVEFAQVHGDAGACQRLYEALAETGAIKGPKRQSAFLRWLIAFTPVRMNSKTGVFALIKRKNADGSTNKMYKPFDSDGLESNNFLDFVPEQAKSKFTQEKLHKAFASSLKKLGDKVAAGEFEGEFDAAALQTFVNEQIAGFVLPTVAAE